VAQKGVYHILLCTAFTGTAFYLVVGKTLPDREAGVRSRRLLPRIITRGALLPLLYTCSSHVTWKTVRFYEVAQAMVIGYASYWRANCRTEILRYYRFLFPPSVYRVIINGGLNTQNENTQGLKLD
jgi:hypothetical protein